MIGERFNFEDVFFRDLTVCVLDTLEGEVKWVNKFSAGDRVVNVPFYYSLTGDERFVLDSFTDDVVSNSRYVDLNTDIIPRGHLTMTNYEIRSDEFANPNVWLKMVVENSSEIKNYLTKLRAIPIVVRYDLSIHLSSEIDTFKCSQAILDTLWLYRFMYFEHNFMNIDAVMMIPDTSTIEIVREKNLTSDNTIKLTLSFEVQTYYPSFRKPKLPDSFPYSIETDYNIKSVNIKLDILQKSNNEVIYSEYHYATTSSDGTVVVQLGAGSSVLGNYLNINLNSSGLMINTYLSISDGGPYELHNSQDWDPNLYKDPLAYNDKNQAWSNAYTVPTPDGDFRDIIIYPKRTRWYNNLKTLKGNNMARMRNEYNNQDINNQKKTNP